ncbi:transposase [bacterium]|nr:transposase [bacterium]
MARNRRGIRPGAFYHVCNRAIEKRVLFQAPSDFDLWVRTLKECLERYPLKIHSFCVMPNHWHLLASSPSAPLFTRAMQWLGATHAIRWRKRAQTIGKGAVYQSRYRCHSVKPNQVFWVVARYIERNPVRAGLVGSPFDWEWSSAGQKNGHSVPLADWPLTKPGGWGDFLKQGGDQVEEVRIREALLRGRPPRSL